MKCHRGQFNILLLLLQMATPFIVPYTYLFGSTNHHSSSRRLTFATLGVLFTYTLNTSLFLILFLDRPFSLVDATNQFNRYSSTSNYYQHSSQHQPNYYNSRSTYQSLMRDQQANNIYYSPSHFQSIDAADSSSSSGYSTRNANQQANNHNMISGTQAAYLSTYQPTCPSACTCSSDNRVVCRERGLTEIPSNIPDTVTELRLEMNRIREVPSKAFSRFKHLRRIDLNNNEIVKVAADAFYGLKHLDTLVLYGNSITELGQGIFKGLNKLELLLLNANNISCIRSDLFADLSNMKLLSLYDNHIQSLANGTFDGLKSIQTIHIGSNQLICDCNLRWLGAYLRQNPVETSDARCAEPKRVAKKKLASLDLDKFKCKGSEQFRTKFAGHCMVDEQCPTQCTCEGSVVNCAGRQLTEIPSNLPLYTTILKLSDNRIRRLPANGLFKRQKHLVSLDLKRNQIDVIEDSAFVGANALNELLLSENRIRKLTSRTFVGLRNLETLTLRSNKLTCIVNDTFGEMENLRLLSLYENDIRCLQPNAFNGLKSLLTLNLVNNPLSCTCNMQWFNKYLVNAGSSLITGNPTCASPANLRGIPVQDVEQNDFACPASEQNLIELQQNCDQTICPPQCICSNGLVRCSKRHLKEWPRFIDTRTTELFLDINELTEIPAQINQLSELIKLDLSNNRLTILQDYIFYNFTKLETLLLSFNKLKCIQSQAFIGMTRLRILSLHSNDLSTLPEGTFKDLININHVALGSNPWYCDCSLAWLSDWTKSGYNEVGIARCAEPFAMSNKLLLSTPTDQFQCTIENRPNRTVLAKCDICYSSPCQNNGICKRKLATSSIGQQSSYELSNSHLSNSWSIENQKAKLDQRMKFDDDDGLVEHLDQSQLESQSLPLASKLYRSRFSSDSLDPMDTLMSDDANINPPSSSNQLPTNGQITIVNASELFAYTCECEPGFFGTNCEQRIDACFGSPCSNGGKCELVDENNFVCLCLSGFTGDVCETNIDDCVDHSCKNGAKCIDGVNSYSCDCLLGFTGKYCEKVFEYCSAPEYNPCQNSATCIPTNRDYICECKSGFSGRNCSENINECLGHLCQNGAKCVDGVNSYSCECSNGFTGQFCEQAPEIEQLAKTSPCQQSDCVHGYCFQPNSNSTEYYCKCSSGYMGKRCDILSSISFHSGQAYLQFDPLENEVVNDLNVTLDLVTSAEFGILLYAGQVKPQNAQEKLNQHHLAIELYRGRIRVSLNLANHSTATMFSYELVNDGVYHEVQLHLKGNRFTMKVDSSTRSIKNDAFSSLRLKGAPLFIGGLSSDYYSFATKHRHVWNKHSFLGCMRGLQMNGQLLDIQMAISQQRVTPGCVQFSTTTNGGSFLINGQDQMDSATRFISSATSMAVTAVKPSDQQLNDEQAMVQELIGNETDLKRQSKTHYLHHNHTSGRRGKHQKKVEEVQTIAPAVAINQQIVTASCTRKYFTDFYRENDCVSTRKVRQAKCSGTCTIQPTDDSQPKSGCCKATRHRTKAVNMKCEDGRTFAKKLSIVRKCSCSTKSVC